MQDDAGLSDDGMRLMFSRGGKHTHTTLGCLSFG